MSDSFRGLQILLVDAFEDTRPGRVYLQAFRDCVHKCLSECGVKEPLLINRRLDMLKDYAVDWEHDLMDDETRACARCFDKLDLIIVGGDSAMLPWDPRCMQLVSLFNMANKINKPVFCCGSAAFTYIYSLSTCGLRFNILNGPVGGLLKDLPGFNHYTVGAGVYPGGYLGNEVGDFYTYDPQHNAWEPKCNIGLHYSGGALVSLGIGGSKSFFSREHRSHPVAAPNASIANIRASRQQHYCLKYLEKSYFSYTDVPDWVINNEGGLPAVTSKNLQIIAESYSGPVLLSKGNAVILASLIKEGGPSHPCCVKICLGWMGDILSRMQTSNRARLDGNLYNFLFSKVSRQDAVASSANAQRGLSGSASGSNSNSESEGYETLVEKEFFTCAPALTKFAIKSTLKEGPKLIPTPVLGLYFPPVMDNAIDYDALIKAAKNVPAGVNTSTSTRTTTPLTHIVRHPTMQTELRMRDIMSKGGYDKSIKVFKQMEESDKRTRGESSGTNGVLSPREIELMSGKVLDTSGIFASKNSKLKGKTDVFAVLDGAKVISNKANLDDIKSIFSDGDEARATEGISRMTVGVTVNLSSHNRTAGDKRLKEELGLGNKQANDILKGKYDANTGKIVRMKSNANIRVNFLNGNVDNKNGHISNNNEEKQRIRPSTAGSSRSTSTSKMLQDNFLPVRRPNPDKDTGADINKLSVSARASAEDVVKLRATDRPSYFYQGLPTDSSEYKGYYADGIVYTSSHERETKEEAEKKKKALFGEFLTRHGPASTMDVRQEGAVQGIYLDPPNPNREMARDERVKTPGHGQHSRMYGTWK